MTEKTVRTRVMVGLVLIGSVCFLVGFLLALWPFQSSVREGALVRGVACGAPVHAVGLADTAAALERLSRLPRDESGVAPSSDDLARLVRLERRATEFRACQRPAAGRMSVAGVLEVAGVALVLTAFLVGRRHAPFERGPTDEPTVLGGNATGVGRGLTVRRWDLALLIALAVTVRTGYNLAFLSDYLPVSDADHYNGIARNIAAGRGFSHPFPFPDPVPQATAFRPPLYPILLGVAYWVFGQHLFVAQALNVVLGTGAVLLVALVANRFVGRQGALVAGILAAMHPSLLANDGPPLSEPIGLVLLLGTILALRLGSTTWAGFTTGLLILTRPSAQGFAIVVAVWVLWRLGVRRAIRFGVVVALVVAPWVVRNWVELGSPVLVTSNGFNLAALYSTASVEQGRWLDPVFDERLAGTRRGATDEVELDRRFRDEALRSIRRGPFEVVKVSLQNALDLVEVPPYRQQAAEISDGRNLSLRYLTLPMVWSVIIVGTLGLWSIRRTRGVGPLVISAVYFFLITLPFSPGAPRLRAPVDVVLCVGVGAAWAAHREGRSTPGGEAAVELQDGLSPA